MSPKTGRPSVENPKEARFSVMLDADTAKQVEDYCKEKGITKGEFMRRATITFFCVEGVKKSKRDHQSEDNRLKELRKRAGNIGYGIRKGVRQPDSTYAHEKIMGYAIIDRSTNLVIMGYSANESYNMDIDDVEAFLDENE